MSAHRAGATLMALPVKFPEFVVGEVVPIKGISFKVVAKTKRGLALRRCRGEEPQKGADS